MNNFVSRPNTDYLVIWMNQVLVSIQQNNTEWIQTQKEQFKNYPKLIKDSHYFLINSLSSPFMIHLNTIITLQPILSLKTTQNIFTKVCSSVRFTEIAFIFSPILKDIADLLKQPLDIVIEKIYTSMKSSVVSTDEFLELQDSIFSWIQQNNKIQTRIGTLNGSIVSEIVFTIILTRYVTDATEEPFLSNQMIQIERKLRHLSPINTAIVYNEIAKSPFVSNRRPALKAYFQRSGDRFANEAECVHLLTEMCLPHSLSEWAFFINQLNQPMRCLIKQYLTFVSRHYAGERLLPNDPLLEEKLKQDFIRYTQNKVLIQNKNHLARLLINDDCPNVDIEDEQKACDNIVFSYQSYAYLEEMEKSKCKIMYGTVTDFFKLSKFHCTLCIHSYKNACNRVRSCSLNNTLEENKQMLNTIYQCMYLRMVYKNQCINMSNKEHEDQIKQQDNGIQKCLTVIDKQTGKAN